MESRGGLVACFSKETLKRRILSFLCSVFLVVGVSDITAVACYVFSIARALICL